MTEARARLSRASLVGDVDQLAEAPLGREHRQRRLHVDARVAASGRSAACGSAGGRPGSKRAVDQQAPDLLERDARRRGPRCRRRGSAARRPPCRARRSRWRRRRRPRGRTGLRSWSRSWHACSDARQVAASAQAERRRMPARLRSRRSPRSAPSPKLGRARPLAARSSCARAGRGVAASASRTLDPKLNAFVDVDAEERAGRRRRDRARRRAAVRRRADRDQEQPRGRRASG